MTKWYPVCWSVVLPLPPSSTVPDSDRLVRPYLRPHISISTSPKYTAQHFPPS